LTQDDKNMALISYAIEGKSVYVPAFNNDTYNIFGFLNINFTDVLNTVDGQNYSQALIKYNLPTIKSKNALNLTELCVNIRDYNGQPFVGRVKKGIYPAKNSLLIKNFDKRSKTMDVINNLRTNFVDQQLWLTVPDGATDEVVGLTTNTLQKMSEDYNLKNVNDISAIGSISLLSLPTKLPSTNTSSLFIACNNLGAGLTIKTFMQSDNSNSSRFKEFTILGYVNIHRIINWKEEKTLDERINLGLSYKDTDFYSHWFVIKNYHDLQNLKLFLVDENGDAIKYGNSTLKRPQYILDLKHYS